MKTLTRIAVSNNKENKTRSFLIMIAVALTTMLITAIGTFGYGGIKGNIENAEAMYGNYEGAFSGLTEKQLHEMKKRGEIDEIGLMAGIGEAHTKGDSSLVWMNEKALDMTNFHTMLQEGSFPVEKEEIAASRVFFGQLGYDGVKIGDRVTVPVRRDGTEAYREKEFIIAGIIKDGIGNESQQSSTVIVPGEYYDSEAGEGKGRYTAYFTLSDNIKGDWTQIEAVIDELAETIGVESRNVYKNSNVIATKYAPASEVWIPCAFICLIVVIFSVVVIYNIFQIGIARKVQEYGKIKAIGATKKQMKKIIVTEGYLLSAIAIPIGLAAGYLVSVLLFNGAMSFAGKGNEYMAVRDVALFSPWVLLTAALISLVTVRMALIRAVKTIVSITPVSAIVYEEYTGNKKGYRKGHKALNITGLIKSDLAINKKRNLTTILVMGLSCILFVTISSLASSIDPEYDARNNVERGDYQIEINYDNNDEVYTENNPDQILKNNPISREAIQSFEAIDGVTKTQTRNYLTFEEEGIKRTVAVFDREGFESELEKSGVVGDFTYDEVSRADGYVYTFSHFMEEAGQKLGDKLEAELFNGKSEGKYSGRAMGSFGSVSADYVITEDTAEKLGLLGDSPAYLWIWCGEEAKAEVEAKIEELYGDSEIVYWEGYDEAYSLADRTTFLFKVLVYTFLGLIGTICFLNMANTMIMNVITRKREFGILQAVGLSNSQLGKMLQLEGIFFTAGSIIISLLIGLPGGYGAYLYCRKEGFFGINLYHFPIWEIGIMVTVLLLMQTALSFVLSRNVKKESIIDRIRY